MKFRVVHIQVFTSLEKSVLRAHWTNKIQKIINVYENKWRGSNSVPITNYCNKFFFHSFYSVSQIEVFVLFFMRRSKYLYMNLVLINCKMQKMKLKVMRIIKMRYQNNKWYNFESSDREWERLRAEGTKVMLLHEVSLIVEEIKHWQ